MQSEGYPILILPNTIFLVAAVVVTVAVAVAAVDATATTHETKQQSDLQRERKVVGAIATTCLRLTAVCVQSSPESSGHLMKIGTPTATPAASTIRL